VFFYIYIYIYIYIETPCPGKYLCEKRNEKLATAVGNIYIYIYHRASGWGFEQLGITCVEF